VAEEEARVVFACIWLASRSTIISGAGGSARSVCLYLVSRSTEISGAGGSAHSALLSYAQNEVVEEEARVVLC
jgi:hypothetical protein